MKLHDRRGISVRKAETKALRAQSLGPCYRCQEPGSPLLEFGEYSAIQARLCQPCAEELEARPIGARAKEASLEREEAQRSLHSTPRPVYPLCPTEAAFLELAVRAVGEERLKAALKSLREPTEFEKAIRPWSRRRYRTRGPGTPPPTSPPSGA